MDIKIYPHQLQGTINIPPSKSITHRALICASLADGKSIIYNPLYCDDTLATINCLRNLGVKIDTYGNKIIVKGVKRYQILKKLNAGDSASTIRFLIPLISLFYNEFSFYGSRRLMKRINNEDLSSLQGLSFSFYNDHVLIKGRLCNNLLLSSNITSQFVSGILFTLPLEKRYIKFDYNNPYVQLTISIMRQFGIDFNQNYFTFNNFRPKQITVESDYSSASFFIAMMLWNKELYINNLSINSLQGDKQIINILKLMGAKFIYNENKLICVSGRTNGVNLNLNLFPDLVPIIASIASVSNGVTKITGIKKLKYKESNRIISVYQSLKGLGANIEIVNDDLIINGKDELEGNNFIPSSKDHRIIMSLVALARKVKNPYVIEGYEYVSKSFPNFFNLISIIGGKYECEI